MSVFRNWIRNLITPIVPTRTRRAASRHNLNVRANLGMVRFEDRITPAVTGSWDGSNLTILATAATDTVAFNTSNAADIQLVGGSITGGPVDASAVAAITITGQAGTQTYDLATVTTGVFSALPVITITATGGDNALVLSDESQSVGILAADNGSFGSGGIAGTFDGVGSVTTGAGDDVFAFSDGATMNGTLAAGTGNNGIDYSLSFSAVTVDLGAGTATGTAGISGFENATGGAAADTLVAGPGTSTLVGNDGDDTFVVAPDDTVAGSLNVTITGGSGTDKIDFSAAVYSGSTGIVIDLDLTTTPQDLDGAAAQGDSVTLTDAIESGIGTAKNDQFFADADAGMTGRDIDGGAGTDTLSFDLSTASPAGAQISAGSITGLDPTPPGTFAATTHSNVEQLAIDPAGEVVFNGTAGSDTLSVVNTTDAASGAYTVSFNAGATVYSGTLSSVTKLTFNADAGADAFNLTHRDDGLFAPVDGVFYDAGAGDDRLNILEGGATATGSDSYAMGTSAAYGTGSDVGTISQARGGDSLTLEFQNLADANAPITDDVLFATIDIYADNGGNAIALTDGAAGRLNVAADGYASIDFQHKPTVTLHGGDETGTDAGDDSITVDFATATSGATAVTVAAEGGDDLVGVLAISVATTVTGDDGADTITVGDAGNTLDGIAAPLSVDGGAGSDALSIVDTGTTSAEAYTLTNASVVRASGTETVNYATVEALTLSGGSGGNAVAVQSTASDVTATTVNAGTGADVVNIGAANKVDGILGALTVNGQGGSDALNYNDTAEAGAQTYSFTSTAITRGGVATVTYATAESIALNAGAAGDTISVLSVLTGTSATVNAGGGNDTIAVGNSSSLGTIQGSLTVNGNAGSDSLTLDDAATNAATTVTVTGTTVARSGIPTITYGTTETLAINAGLQADVIDVQGTSAVTSILAGSGDDTVTIGDTGSLDAILAAVSVAGGSGTDILTINDQGDLDDNSYAVTNAAVTRVSGGVSVGYTAIEALNLNAGTGADTLDVQSTAAAVATSVDGGVGADVVNVGNANLVSGILGALTVAGGNGSDELNYNDAAETTGNAYTLTGTTIARTGVATVTYGTAEAIAVNAGTGNDTIAVQSTSGGTTVAVNANAGTDAVNIGLANAVEGIDGPLTVNAGAGSDTLNYNDSADTTAHTYTVTGTTIDRASGDAVGTVTYSAAEAVNVNAGTGNDTVAVQSTVAGATTRIDGGAGNDAVAVGNGVAGLGNLAGALNVFGNTGSDSVAFNDQAGGAGRTYALTSTTLSRNGASAVNVAQSESLTLNTSTTSSSPIQVAATVAANGMPVAINALGASDTLTATNLATTWTVGAANGGSFASVTGSTVTFTGSENLTGGAAADTFNFTGGSISGAVNGGAGLDKIDLSSLSSGVQFTLTGNNAGTAGAVATFAAVENLTGTTGNDTFNMGASFALSGTLDAGTGVDWLNYAAYTTAVNVNLSLASPTATSTGGVRNFENVAGGSGNDVLTGSAGSNVLLGNGGADRLTGLAGDDMLVGGIGADVLDGGDGDDLLVGSSTDFDASTTSWSGLQAAWLSQTTLAGRTTAINTFSGGSFLSHVIDDGAVDRLTDVAGGNLLVN